MFFYFCSSFLLLVSCHQQEGPALEPSFFLLKKETLFHAAVLGSGYVKVPRHNFDFNRCQTNNAELK